ncbi:MAG: amino acid racemase [candidate division WOR-3 bacterium]|nr:MAG: amino acid racemase [candidate division WOR-3 bacterium]
MKKIGIVGGLGPESTVDYYRTMVNEIRGMEAGEAPEIIIYSLNLKDFPPIEQKDAVIAWLVGAVRALERAGADFAIISANTPHIFYNEVKKLSPLPLLSIVEETAAVVRSMGLPKVGLLGTGITMSSDYYHKVFKRHNIEIVVPKRDEQDYVVDKLFSEIILNRIVEETRRNLLRIVKRMVDEDRIQGLILGCTELPLILEHDEYGIPFLNTTKIHVKGAIRYCTTGF